MPSSAERAAAMREAAKDLDKLAKVEEAARAAKAAYRDNPDDPKAKAKHREASQALSDARTAVRSAETRVVPGDGVTITPSTVGGGK